MRTPEPESRRPTASGLPFWIKSVSGASSRSQLMTVRVGADHVIVARRKVDVGQVNRVVDGRAAGAAIHQYGRCRCRGLIAPPLTFLSSTYSAVSAADLVIIDLIDNEGRADKGRGLHEHVAAAPTAIRSRGRFLDLNGS